LAFLIEHLGGAFPTWMSPVQSIYYSRVRSFLWLRSGAARYAAPKLITSRARQFSEFFLIKRFRESVTRKIPNMAIIGGKEVEQGNVTLRRYCVQGADNAFKRSFC
jgi:threonyl-tRNA synthetase